MTIRGSLTVFLSCAGLVLAATTLVASGQAKPSVAEGTRITIPNETFPVDVLVESPALAKGDLQVICLFRSVPENKLLASLDVLNQRLGGTLAAVRDPTLFRGELGETLLVEPKAGAVGAKRLLIVGLGDRPSFTPEREELVGEIVYAESERLGVSAPTFAPTVLDGGAAGFDTGVVGAEFLRGFLRGRALAVKLHADGSGPAPSVTKLTFLAGTAHAIDTQKGLTGVLESSKQ